MSLSLILLLGLISFSQGVILSLEESELGAKDYRYLFLTVPDIDGGFYQKPYFTIVNDKLSRPYGALGSLVCGSSTDGIAVYSDVDGDTLKEWTCQSINLLPFAHEGGGVPIPPICSVGAPTGIPAIWNMSLQAWECGTYNQILTLATREDISTSCVTADFLMFYESVDEIRCVNPLDIDPALTLTTRNLEERVDIKSDKKWYTVMSDYDVTAVTSRTWNFWRWTPFLNYDSTSGSSLVPSPPIALPFVSTLIAATFASFKVTSYSWILLAPTSADSFVGTVSKLSNTLSETPVSSTLNFNSISATSGSVTYGFSGNALAVSAAGETFVGGIINKSWTTLPISSDRHMITITLWIQTTQSFTSFFPLP